MIFLIGLHPIVIIHGIYKIPLKDSAPSALTMLKLTYYLEKLDPNELCVLLAREAWWDGAKHLASS